MIETQHDNSRHQQELVRQRIQNRSELTSLIVTARNIAIHAVTNRSNCKAKKRQNPMHFVTILHVIENLDHEERNQKNSQDGDLVGSSHGGPRAVFTDADASSIL